MANYSLADVKVLRDRLGAGMLDSKNALVEADGDLEKAIEILRVKGLKGVAKREGRTTTAGLVTAGPRARARATIIELASETDFVAKNDKFIALAENVLKAVAASGCDHDRGRQRRAARGHRPSRPSSTTRPLCSARRSSSVRSQAVTGDEFAIYLHKTRKDLPPQVGVVVGYTGGDAETARSIAQHIAFAAPTYLSRDEVPAEDVARERAIVEETAKNEGKPEAGSAQDHRRSPDRLLQGDRSPRPGLRQRQQAVGAEGPRRGRHDRPGLRPDQGRRVIQP